MAHTSAMDGSELFSECLVQATRVVKQVLPGHFANPTPEAELDVRDLTNHMVGLLESVPGLLAVGRLQGCQGQLLVAFGQLAID